MKMEFERLAKQLIEQAEEANLSSQLNSKTKESENWKVSMTHDIIETGSDFLKNLYQLGYTGEAGDSDINEIVAILAQEVEADDRLHKALDAVVTHMVNAGHADM